MIICVVKFQVLSFSGFGSGINLVDVGFTSSDDSLDDVVPFSLNDQESWHGLDVVSCREFSCIIYVDLHQWNSFLLGFFMDIWGDSFAWSAPGSIAVNDGNTSVGIQERLNFLWFGSFDLGHDF